MPPSIDVLTSSSAADWPTVLMPWKRPLPSPNVMVPKQRFETRRPVLPSVAYSMAFSFLVRFIEQKVSPGGSLPERIKPSLCVALCLCRLTGDEIHRRIGDRTHNRRHERRWLAPQYTSGRALTPH